MADNGVVCSSMSRSGNVWDNAAMESFFSSLKTERTAKLYRTTDEARADVFDCRHRCAEIVSLPFFTAHAFSTSTVTALSMPSAITDRPNILLRLIVD